MKYFFNDRELDVGTRTVTHGGEALHVEPQVYDLILYLAENRSRVVDKDELLARVWKGRLVSDATIASRINAARRAVGDDGRRQSVIRTISRRGFRFMDEVTVEGDTVGRPAVAVLPFTLVGRDSGDVHLARGLADELAAALGQAAWFDVRDTAASFAPELDNLPPDEIARRLKVRSLIFGSLQATPDRLKLTVRLVDPEDDRAIWSGSLDGSRDDIFVIQDRIASQLLGEIEPRLRRLELQRSRKRHGSFTAFDHYLRAADILRGMDVPAMRAASVELDKAVAEFPEYAAAHGMRAWIATLMLAQGQRVDAKAELERSRLAVSQGSFDCDALAMGGYALGFFDRHPAVGLDYVRRALAINPSSARAHDHAGWLLLYGGYPADAYHHFDRGLSLCPMDEFAFRILTGRAFARLFARDFKNAIEDAERAHAVAPTYSVCHRVLCAGLAQAGREKEARAILRDLLKLNPQLTLSRYSKETRFEGAKDRETLFEGLRRAGWK